MKSQSPTTFSVAQDVTALPPQSMEAITLNQSVAEVLDYVNLGLALVNVYATALRELGLVEQAIALEYLCG